MGTQSADRSRGARDRGYRRSWRSALPPCPLGWSRLAVSRWSSSGPTGLGFGSAARPRAGSTSWRWWTGFRLRKHGRRHRRAADHSADEDFRGGRADRFPSRIDGLGAGVRELLGEDPFSGGVFVFRSRRRHAIKVLAYDGQGFWLCLKRLSKGRLRWWPTSDAGEASRRLAAHELHVLLWNGDPGASRMAGLWRQVEELNLPD